MSTETKSLDAEFYSGLGIEYEAAFGFNHALLDFIEHSLTYLPRNATVLDAGCGTGQPVASKLAASGHRVIGIDVSSVMVELSKEAVPSGEFHVADMREYTVPDGTQLDAIFNILSLSNLAREEIEQLMMRWKACLPVGGMLFIVTLAAEDCQSEARGKGYDPDGRCARDMRFRFMGEYVTSTLFTRLGWKELLEASGFAVVESHTRTFVPPPEAECEEEPQYFIVVRNIRDSHERANLPV
ncbi:S-adenosyl-L-methionine-dependent methyltransferase [Aspergillus terreus]|uniref:S-adenosyl-L-methionine-dependent methyltransferase n=1 Tax=Aspergillus terreus TaxID=33178 RepID=A0A5M3YQY3_ASPTE|nr:hypothetical protein ATETN484_0003014200 [Aspergillus terreus]GFF14150.1 S-adenosyl-L-methionine-dependent methyltransferase [Aspergillus terreus]